MESQPIRKIVIDNVRKKKSYNLKNEILKNKHSYIMIAPYMLLFIFVYIIPMLAAVYLSFTSFNLIQYPKWVGWMNYVRIFLEDDIFLIAVKNTMIFSFLTGPVGYIAAFILAWFISETGKRTRTVLTCMYYIPFLSGGMTVVWLFVFNGDIYGLLNSFLMKLGIVQMPVQWLTDSKYNLYVVMFIQLWMSLGPGFLAFIAGFKSMDKTLYEAGSVEGIKNRWQELWYITIPCMKPMLFFGAIMQISSTFAVAELPMSLTGFPSTDYSTHTIVTHLLDYGTLRYEMGYSCAIAVLLYILMISTRQLISKVLKTD